MRFAPSTPSRALAAAAFATALTFAPVVAQEASIAGDWEGTISAGGAELPLVVHIAEAEDGGLTATLDSPNQGALGIPTTDVKFADGTLTFSVPSVPGGGAYEGTLGEDGAFDGTWSQGMNRVDLDLSRVDADG